MIILKTKTGNIPANETEVLFTDVDIKNDSIIEIYYDSNDVYTVETTQIGDTVKVLTNEHDFPVGVKLLINNVSSFSPYDDGEIVAHLGLVDQTIETLDTEIETLDTEIETLDTELNERVPSETMLGGVLYHGTTGNRWEVLNANNINYDDDSTLYSAMGDIDSLETTSKNLVGAINEVKESGGGGGSSAIVYSTNEREIGTWIDGSKLYEKTFWYTNPAQTGQLPFDTGALNKYKVIWIENTFVYDANASGGVVSTPTNFGFYGSHNRINVQWYSNTWSCYINFQYHAIPKLAITLRYVKN